MVGVFCGIIGTVYALTGTLQLGGLVNMVWFLDIVLITVILLSIKLQVRKIKKKIIKTVIFLLKLFMIVGTAFHLVSIDDKVAYSNGDLLLAVYICLIGDVTASAVMYIYHIIRHEKDKKERISQHMMAHGGIGVGVTFVVLVFGLWNGSHIRKCTHTVESDQLKKTHTIAFISDTHVGGGKSMKSLIKLCNDVNAAQPDIVILGGDITDELTTHDEFIEAYSILSTIESPTYFVYGNHDRQLCEEYVGGRTYTDEELIQRIEKSGIKILTDEYMKVADDLVFLGREDISSNDRVKWKDLSNPYEGKGALIVADHQPYDSDQLKKESSTLQLSGHTHDGQLWPLNILYEMIGLPTHGKYKEPKTNLIVTAGAAEWGLPFRTTGHCEWELVTLQPK